ncbi:MAG TPA: hypothetical protein VFA46_21640 [Actinomycetes bacterium]|jgi:hypothetical protein|nr:hypothetical protein [Actinomycetes bacterium]
MRPTAYRRNACGLRDRQAFEGVRMQAGELFAAGHTQAEVAHQLGVARQNVSNGCATSSGSRGCGRSKPAGCGCARLLDWQCARHCSPTLVPPPTPRLENSVIYRMVCGQKLVLRR